MDDEPVARHRNAPAEAPPEAPDEDEDGAPGRLEEDAARGACANCGQRAARWNRDGSGTVCTRCGATVLVSRVLITFEDIVRTHGEVSRDPVPVHPPFDVEDAIVLIFSERVRAAVHDKMRARITRESRNRARWSFDVAGVPHMRRRLELTAAQKTLLVRYVYRDLIGMHFEGAVDLLARFATDTAHQRWKRKAWLPWMCALFYPPPEITVVKHALQTYFWREAVRGKARVSAADAREAEMLVRHEPAMDPACIVPEDEYAAALEAAYTMSRGKTVKRERDADADADAVRGLSDGMQRLLRVLKIKKAPAPGDPSK